MVARLTPDQKAACSNHVGVNNFFKKFSEIKNSYKEIDLDG